ncbi:hypothetical protein HNQ08_005050 [Deinococcus humi]|uniref:Uncharacterized protein n=1 Tax=Deinococcus humi TaxID=662880 RepID=A0A7W8NFX5_9DEIO|nr:hypothetical protein [Deinococcus humi]GGO40429.1 hypothetical protein GCM10008949_49910 [Deinococcus humi]
MKSIVKALGMLLLVSASIHGGPSAASVSQRQVGATPLAKVIWDCGSICVDRVGDQKA